MQKTTRNELILMPFTIPSTRRGGMGDGTHEDLMQTMQCQPCVGSSFSQTLYLSDHPPCK
jgi:hypothetical protein